MGYTRGEAAATWLFGALTLIGLSGPPAARLLGAQLSPWTVWIGFFVGVLGTIGLFRLKVLRWKRWTGGKISYRDR